MCPTWLIDISHHQSGIDIEQIAAEGYAACICKATEGISFRDKDFDDWIPRVIASGMLPGAYHFLRSSDGAQQARAFHARLVAHGGPSGFLCALDNESDATHPITGAFVDEWNSLTNDHPLIMYTGAWWWKPRGWDGAALTPYLWHSRYVTGSGLGSSLYQSVPEDWWTPGYGGWPSATILQFSSRATVASRLVDVNAFRGSLDELGALANPAADSPDALPARAEDSPPAAPPWPGRYLRYVEGWGRSERMVGADVRVWQRRMRHRGWSIATDGDYGRSSRTICIQFQREKSLATDGVVGPSTWKASWVAPIM